MILDRYDLVIDGYNLMHCAGFARERYGPRELEQQRERFLVWLWKRILPQTRPRTIVVFDAGGADGQYVGLGSHRELRLLYSAQGTEADDVIEELIEVHSAPKRLQVVSSDHRLHKAARHRKATCLDSEEFIRLMARLARQVRERQQALEDLAKPTGELVEETLEWMQVFAEADAWLAEARAPASPRRTGGKASSPTSVPPAPVVEAAASRREEAPAASPPVEPPAAGAVPKGGGEGSIPAAELAFWELRIQELFRSPPKRS